MRRPPGPTDLDVQLGAPLGPWPVPLLGDTRDTLFAQDPPDRRCRQRDGMILTEEEPQARNPVLAFLPDTKHQRFDVRRGPKRAHPGPGQPGPQAVQPLMLVPSAPVVEEGARDPDEPTRPADIAADLFEVLKHAPAGRRPPGPPSVQCRASSRTSFREPF